MKKKLFENIGGNQFKLVKEADANEIKSEVDAYRQMGVRRFELDYSQGMTFRNNLLALYGYQRGRKVWITAFEDYNGDPMPRQEIIAALQYAGLQNLIKDIPDDYDSGQGFQGTHA